MNTLANTADKGTNFEGAATHHRHSGRQADRRSQGESERLSDRPLGVRAWLSQIGESLETPDGAGSGAEPQVPTVKINNFKPLGLRPEKSGDPAHAGRPGTCSGGSAAQPALGRNTGIAANRYPLGPDETSTPRGSKWKVKKMAAELAENRRMKACGYALAGGGNVQVYSYDGQAFYKGLICCGLLWCCPVCAPKITEQRKAELAGAIERYPGTVLLDSRTIRHSKWDHLDVLLPKFLDANRWFTSHRTYKRIRGQLNTTVQTGGGGTVRALEVTHAHPDKWDHNGWHPHSHTAWFCNRTNIGEDELTQAELELAKLWIEACLLAGLPAPDIEHGLKLEANKAGDYIAKWGVAEELTKGHLKQGKGGSLSTWGLLMLADQGNERAAALFAEFAEVFKGRHQLQWSRGLRKILGLGEEKSDQDLADHSEVEATHVCDIEYDDWKRVRRLGLQPNILDAAEDGGIVGVLNFLEGLRISEMRTRDGP